MAQAIAAAILFLVSSLDPVRAVELGTCITRAAEQTGEDPYVLTALYKHESGFDVSAMNARTGAFGLAQLHPLFWGKDLVRGCGQNPTLCTWLQVLRGAEALHHYRQKCGSVGRAVTAYRVGHCRQGPHGPETLKVLRTSYQIRARFAPKVRVGSAVLRGSRA